MNRDLIAHHVVALDAQIQRLRRICAEVRDPVELKARLPRLLELTADRTRQLARAVDLSNGDPK